jgi:hypothetical protein
MMHGLANFKFLPFFKMGNSDSGVSIMNMINSWMSEEAWCYTLREKETFVFFRSSRTFLSCSRPSFSIGSRTALAGNRVSKVVRVLINHTPSSIAEFKNDCSYTYAAHMPSRCDRNKFVNLHSSLLLYTLQTFAVFYWQCCTRKWLFVDLSSNYGNNLQCVICKTFKNKSKALEIINILFEYSLV